MAPALEDSEVTVVLIGEETWDSRWVQYEIRRSIERNNGLLGVYIDGLRDRHGQPSQRGLSPFEIFEIESGHPLTDEVPHYDYANEDGHTNLRHWIADAPRISDITTIEEEDDDVDEEGDDEDEDDEEEEEEDEDDDD